MLRRVVFLGRNARMNWLGIELGHPPRSVLQRHCMVVSDNFDIDMMRGYAPGALRYIAADPTNEMWEFVTSRSHQRISFDEVKQWLRSLYPTN